MDYITISDDTSSSSSRNIPEKATEKSPSASAASLPITIHSNTTERCAGTWNSNQKQRWAVAPQFVTPKLQKRVNLWLASSLPLAETSPASNYNDFDNLDEENGPNIIEEYFRKPRHFDELPKRNILIRHDFNKEDNILSNDCHYKPKWRSSSGDNLENCKEYSEKSVDSCSIGKIDDEVVNIDNKKPKLKFNNNVIPLSPESQKKNELCSYLQLMNMNLTDKKIGDTIQNRRSTRVKNLIILSKKKELEKRLNTEAMNREKDDTKELGDNIIDRDESREVSDDENSNEMIIKEGIIENIESESEIGRNFFNIDNIPRYILEECRDFDDAIKSFIPSNFKSNEKHIHVKKDTESEFNMKLNDKSNVERPKDRINGKLGKSSKGSLIKSLKLKSPAKKLPKKMKSFKNESEKRHLRIKNPNSLISRPNFSRILLRHGGRRNLRSKLSLSDVGIKTLILKDKRIKKAKKIRSPVKNMLQTRLRTRNQRNIYDKNLNKRKLPKNVVNEKRKKENDQRLFIRRRNQRRGELEKKIDKKGSPPNKEKSKNLEVKEITPEEVKKAEVKGDVNNIKVNDENEVKGEEKVVTPKPVKRKLIDSKKIKQKQESITPAEISPTIGSPKIDLQQKMSPIKVTEGEKVKEIDVSKEIKEKSFNVIDLSHSKSAINNDTLNDHNYSCIKPKQIDRGYIMNVILSTNDKSPVGEKPEDKSITDEIYEKSSDILSSCKDGEYCKEMLEEIIGIPWRNRKIKNVEEVKEKKESLAIQTDAVMQYEYSSYQDTLILNSNNSNKLFNILLEPPTNIFDEGPCSPNNREENSEITAENNVEGKPKIITTTVPPQIKSLHKSLRGKRKGQIKNSDLYGETSNHTWENDNEEKRSHLIKISMSNGRVMNAFYIDFNLAIVQEQMVSFWCQSALGNMLGSQDMWIYKGSVQRLLLDSNCLYKESSNMVISLENSFAYVELWTKEHKSDKRERPLADVFATVYFWRHRQNVPDKKVLQLETINGKVSDVQYIVLRNSRNIVVSWVETRDDTKKNVVHCYCFAPDYQTVISIREIDTIDHHVSSLHNIEDCNNMIMGYGEEHITLWNLEYGYVVATIEIKGPVSTNYQKCIWTKCDRGFLFLLQYHQSERLLVLIAVNGINHSWKRLQVFRAPPGYDGLRGVCIDNNVLAAFYQRGVLCWNIQSGESVIEEMSSQTSYMPCDKHVIMLNSDKVQVQQFLSYFITSFDLQ